jgi:hypothetical protein
MRSGNLFIPENPSLRASCNHPMMMASNLQKISAFTNQKMFNITIRIIRREMYESNEAEI